MVDPTTDQLLAIGRHFLHETTVAQALRAICEGMQTTLPQTVYVGVTMTIDARPDTYVLTDPALVEVDHVQYETGEGPCIDTLRSGSVTAVASTAGPGPYPAFRRTASRLGVMSTLGLPMIAGDELTGALNLFAREEHAFGDDDVEVGERYATQAAYILTNTKAYWDARVLNENLAEAMKSRAVIEQAKGIIIGSTGVSAEEAFDRLREQSQHENVKLRDLAQSIVRQAQRGRAHAVDDDAEV